MEIAADKPREVSQRHLYYELTVLRIGESEPFTFYISLPPDQASFIVPIQHMLQDDLRYTLLHYRRRFPADSLN